MVIPLLARVPAPPGRRALDINEMLALGPYVIRCLSAPGAWAPGELLLHLSRKLETADDLFDVLKYRFEAQLDPLWVDSEALAWPHERGESSPAPIQVAPLQDCAGDCGRAVRSADGLCRECRALLAAAADPFEVRDDG